MRFASSLSLEDTLDPAASETIGRVNDELGSDVDLVVAFASREHAVGWFELAARLEEAFPNALTLGCSARSVIGAGHEAERGAGLSLFAARLPDVVLHPLRLEGAPPDAPRPELELDALAGAAPQNLILLADPFSCDVEHVIGQIDGTLAGSVQVGGLASGAEAPGQNALLLGGEVHNTGLVGVALSGDIAIDTIVAQGCKPIGSPLFVTRARENVVLEVDQRPPLELIQELYNDSPPEDQALFQGSLFLGIQMREQDGAFTRGDFLVRNLIGGDPESGAIAVAAQVPEGSVVQLHLRDGRASAEDLDERLAQYADSRSGSSPAQAALLFSCLGRGEGLYGVPHHDSARLKERLGALPMAGFFCNGEIGPVQGQTFLHGYTSSFGILRAG